MIENLRQKKRTESAYTNFICSSFSRNINEDRVSIFVCL